jgi:hypothetical protein
VNNNSVHSKILQFKREVQKISVGRLRTLTLTNKNTPLKIWGTTIEGDEYNGREVFTFNGPSRNPGVPYNYNALGYMIFFDMGKGDYRTFVYDLITKLEMNGVTYEITGGFNR